MNDTSIIDGRSLFAPEISLVNINMIWDANSSMQASDLLSPKVLEARAQALVNAGAAVNLAGASAILNATIDLATRAQRKDTPSPFTQEAASRDGKIPTKLT